MEQANTKYLDELCGGDAAFLSKMISINKTELPQEITSYSELLNKKQYQLTANCVHKLKHKISVLGLEKSYYIAEQFENNLKNGSTALQDDFEKIATKMQDFVANL